MSTRILSAYFDDVRKGKKDVALIRQFLLDTYDRDPVKRGHLLNWLDQAQYEHPIPVTDFLLLRKEVEAALKVNGNRPPVDDATVIAAPAAPVSPDSETLVAAPVSTMTTEAVDLTLVAGGDDGATRIVGTQDSTPLPDRSDNAGQHYAATTIRPHAADTLIQSTPIQAPGRSFAVSRRFMIGSGIAIAALALLGALALTLWLRQQAGTATAVHSETTLSEVNHVLSDQPAGSIGTPQTLTPPPPTAAQQISDSVTTMAEPIDLESLTEQALQQEIVQRAEQGKLLPITSVDSAYEALRVLIRRFPDSEGIVLACIAIKNAHLKRSDAAREQGEWELAQQHLDAAFDVLQQAAN